MEQMGPCGSLHKSQATVCSVQGLAGPGGLGVFLQGIVSFQKCGLFSQGQSTSRWKFKGGQHSQELLCKASCSLLTEGDSSGEGAGPCR